MGVDSNGLSRCGDRGLDYLVLWVEIVVLAIANWVVARIQFRYKR
jgi:hypothetical protein